MPIDEKKPRPLMMKFRIRPTKRMRMSTAMRLLKQAVRTGIVPDGIEIAWMDWEKGSEGKLNAGQIPGDQWQELRNFYGAMAAVDQFRVARVIR